MDPFLDTSALVFVEKLNESIFIQLRKILLILVVALMASCVTQEADFGYLKNENSSVVSGPSEVDIRSRGVLLRILPENRLHVSLGGAIDEQAVSSVIPSNYFLLIQFSTDAILPNEKPDLFIPILFSKHIGSTAIDVGLNGDSLLLTINSDRIGVDLVFASMLSPGGLQGMVRFPKSSVALPIEAIAYRPEFVWARLWSGHNIMFKPCVGIENISEFSYKVFAISLDGIKFEVDNVVEPYQINWVCNSKFSSGNLRGLTIDSAIDRSRVPAIIFGAYEK